MNKCACKSTPAEVNVQSTTIYIQPVMPGSPETLQTLIHISHCGSNETTKIQHTKVFCF